MSNTWQQPTQIKTFFTICSSRLVCLVSVRRGKFTSAPRGTVSSRPCPARARTRALCLWSRFSNGLSALCRAAPEARDPLSARKRAACIVSPKNKHHIDWGGGVWPLRTLGVAPGMRMPSPAFKPSHSTSAKHTSNIVSSLPILVINGDQVTLRTCDLARLVYCIVHAPQFFCIVNRLSVGVKVLHGQLLLRCAARLHSCI